MFFSSTFLACEKIGDIFFWFCSLRVVGGLATPNRDSIYKSASVGISILVLSISPKLNYEILVNPLLVMITTLSYPKKTMRTDPLLENFNLLSVTVFGIPAQNVSF